jgi:hypothetical protein
MIGNSQLIYWCTFRHYFALSANIENLLYIVCMLDANEPIAFHISKAYLEYFILCSAFGLLLNPAIALYVKHKLHILYALFFDSQTTFNIFNSP